MRRTCETDRKRKHKAEENETHETIPTAGQQNRQTSSQQVHILPGQNFRHPPCAAASVRGLSWPVILQASGWPRHTTMRAQGLAAMHPPCCAARMSAGVHQQPSAHHLRTVGRQRSSSGVFARPDADRQTAAHAATLRSTQELAARAPAVDADRRSWVSIDPIHACKEQIEEFVNESCWCADATMMFKCKLCGVRDIHAHVACSWTQ